MTIDKSNVNVTQKFLPVLDSPPLSLSEQSVLQEDNRLLRLVMNHVTHAVLVIDQQRRLLLANKAFTEMFGYTLDEVRGQAPGEFLASPETDLAALERLRSRSWMKGGYQEEMLARDKYGRDLWVNCSLNPVTTESGEVVNAVVVIEDITEYRLIRDLERDVLRVLASNTSFKDLGNYIARRVREIAPDILPSILTVDHERRLRSWAVDHLPDDYNAMVDGVLTGEGMGSCGTVVARGKAVISEDIATDELWQDYKDIPLKFGLRACWSYPIRRRDGSVAGTFAFYSKQPSRPMAFHNHIIEASTHLCALAIEREESQLEIRRLVQFDQLTGLPNRNHLSRYLDEQIRLGATKNIAVFSIGLDRFKDVNDALGHAAGDGVLVRIASRLLAHLDSGEFLGRADGDLFVVIATQCDDERAVQLAERFRAVVGMPLNIGLHINKLSLSASVGVCLYPGGGSNYDELLVHAKKAMYKAKGSGGSTSRLYDHEMHHEAKSRLFLGTELRNAIAEGRLYLQYQPQVMAVGGALYGVEALIRWADPVLGVMLPERFIGLAEEVGEIEILGYWALREACRQMAVWRSEGMQVPTVSVNLSPFSFRDHSLPNRVSLLLQEFGLKGSDLTIEITESAAMSLTLSRQEIVHELRALGVGLSVDDFGTGFSSLSNLVHLPVTEVKIDRSFIEQSLQKQHLRALVTAVIEIGQALKLDVVAEGVETAEQKELLVLLQCPVLQGYLYAKPLSPDEMSVWLASHFNKNAIKC